MVTRRHYAAGCVFLDQSQSMQEQIGEDIVQVCSSHCKQHLTSEHYDASNMSVLTFEFDYIHYDWQKIYNIIVNNDEILDYRFTFWIFIYGYMYMYMYGT